MDPPQRPLSSLAGKSIFRYFNFKQRKTVSRRCPSTRKWHRTFPFRFDQVAISYDDVEIDNFKWTFDPYHKFNPQDSADEEANRNSPTKKFTADERIPFTVTNPSGKKFFFDNKDAFNRLLNHYINRNGNEIRHLEIQTFWENIQEFVGVKVRELTMRSNALCTSEIVKENRDKFMNNFKKNEFDRFCINGDGGGDEIVEQLKDMNIKHLQLTLGTLRNQKIHELYFEKVGILEGDYFYQPPSDGILFVDRITPLIARSHDKTLGYRLDYLYFPDFDPKVIVKLVKERWGAEHKYRNYAGVLAFDINDEWEVQIACYLGQLGPWTESYLVNSVALEATFMEKETLVPAAELSKYKRILRRMHIWQCSVTEFLKKSYRLEYYCENHKVVAKCLFFLNDYHLRFITFLLFFGFYSLVLSVLSMLGFTLGAPLWLLASLVLAGIANYLFLLPYKYDCRGAAYWDIAAE